ncbi:MULTISPECIES: hypothetical protein [Pseudomonas]|jgi:hypothetical protein|uniref:Uncharacterized protein n=1 Tax=Pseudomonas fluorescens TaxID=294 RepID=A0A166QNM9_PSEFL|nr:MULTISPECIES: hypothetical protein [Pseudomonas]KZN20594.1 hypothetical protein A1D17_03380 [Pseudomonas fluorescens]
MAEGSSSQSGPFRQLLSAVIAVTLCIYVAKIYLRAPEYRHIEACYLPYIVAHKVWVDAWGMVVPDDNASYLKHSRDLSNFFDSCSEYLAGKEWLRSIGSPAQDQ